MTDDDWVVIPNEDDQREMSEIDKNRSADSNIATQESSPPKDPQNPSTKRYSSPLFQNLLGHPIEPVKISKATIPDDDSIRSLIQTANLVTKSQKTDPELSDPVESTEISSLQTTNTTNEENAAALDEFLLKNFSVPEKRPSVQDPETVLMANVVPGECAHLRIETIGLMNSTFSGSIAEREHLKWLHAAPIANNPYSMETLQRRLSETDPKHKNLDISNNAKLVDALVEESAASEADKDENEVDFQPKKVDMQK